jgi:hypothetical protein
MHYHEFDPVWIQGGYTVGHFHHPAVILQTLPIGVSHQQTAVVPDVSHVPVSIPVIHSHEDHHALPLASEPSSPRHSSAVNSAGTSTASDLLGRYGSPPLSTTRQVSLKTAVFRAQHNVQERDNFKVFLLLLPDEE